MSLGAGDDSRMMTAALIVKGLELSRDDKHICQCPEDSEAPLQGFNQGKT